MKAEFTFDKNGNYLYEGKRFLVNFIRGSLVDRENPHYVVDRKRHVYNLYQPALLQVWYPGPVGCTCAIVVGDEIRYGYSHVHTGLDQFSKRKAVSIALNRALHTNVKPLENDYRWDIQESLEDIYYRARSYFKNR